MAVAAAAAAAGGSRARVGRRRITLDETSRSIDRRMFFVWLPVKMTQAFKKAFESSRPGFGLRNCCTVLSVALRVLVDWLTFFIVVAILRSTRGGGGLTRRGGEKG